MQNSHIITDIHAHVLPNVDDGPENPEQTQALLHHFHQSGVQRIVCTSHYNSPHFTVQLTDMVDAYDSVVAQMNSSLTAQRNTQPELILGAEVRLSPALKADLRANCVPTLGQTSYVLVEFASNEVSQSALEMVYELTVRGLQPIMAHPERNIAIQKNPALLEQLQECGLLFQLTANCFIDSSKEARMTDKLAWSILQNGKATLVASDAHNTTTRPPTLVAAYDNIAHRFGQAVIDGLIENANAIWYGEACSEIPASKQKGRRFGLLPSHS